VLEVSAGDGDLSGASRTPNLCIHTGLHHRHLHRAKTQNGLIFWYRFTQLVLEYWPSNDVCDLTLKLPQKFYIGK